MVYMKITRIKEEETYIFVQKKITQTQVLEQTDTHTNYKSCKVQIHCVLQALNVIVYKSCKIQIRCVLQALNVIACSEIVWWHLFDTRTTSTQMYDKIIDIFKKLIKFPFQLCILYLILYHSLL